MRWHYRDAGLLWLFVPAYGLHLLEEWFGGFPRWTALVVGRPLPPTAFVVINATAMALVVFGIGAAVRSERAGWAAVAIATVFLINTISHAAGSVLTGTYSPGLVSAVVLYVPLGALTLARAFEQAPRDQLRSGLVAGAVLHALVFVVAFLSTR